MEKLTRNQKRARHRKPGSPEELAALEKEQQKLAALEKEMQVALRPDRQPVRKRPKIFLIILLIGAVWGMLLWHEYYKHPFPRWFLATLCASMVLFFSGFLVYGVKRGRIYAASIWGGRGDWIYRDDTPLIYWFGMAFYLLWDSACVYQLFELLTKGSV